MRAVTLEGFGTPAVVRDDLPAPAVGAMQVLVRVEASSANPVDNAIAAGMLKDMLDHDFPVTLGRDYAGVVEEAGPDAVGFTAGDAVFGFLRHANPSVADGAWAEFVSVPADGPIAPAPAGVDAEVSGAAPLAGITALTAIDALGIGRGDTVLIVGATGGVGTFAVQLAVAAGATVIAPGLPEDDAYLRDLGVSEVLPRDADAAVIARAQHADGVDAVLDLVSYAPGAFEGALKDGGRVASPNGAAGEGPGRTNVMALPTRENLDRLAALLADGTLKVPIQETYGLAEAPAALAALGGTHTRGKIAIRVA
jgi:NADPH2:quinone reductase